LRINQSTEFAERIKTTEKLYHPPHPHPQPKYWQWASKKVESKLSFLTLFAMMVVTRDKLKLVSTTFK